VRAFAETALETLLKSGASTSAPPESRDVEGQIQDALSALLLLLPEELQDPSSPPNGPFIPKYTLLTRSLEFQASLIADLINVRRFSDAEVWNRSIGLFMKGWIDSEHSHKFADTVREHFLAIDKVFD
jgi:elongation factor 3